MEGDESDFDEFTRRMMPSLYRAAFVLCGGHETAEDLAQSALLKVYRSWGRRRAWQNPDAYARRVLYTTFCSVWHQTRNSSPGEASEPTVDGGQLEVELAIDIRQALGRLPRRARAVVVLRYLEGLSVEETAAVLGCSQGTVKSQTSRALKLMRVSMTSDEPAALGVHGDEH